MQQTDINKLAQQFMGNAVRVQPDDNIWIEYQGPKAKVLADACKDVVESSGAHAHMIDSSAETVNATIGPMTPAAIEAMAPENLAAMRAMQGYIRVRDDADKGKIALNAEQKTAHAIALGEMTDYRVNNTRWLVVSTPTEEFAKACNMTLPEFEDFYRDVCLVDYNRMTETVKPLEKLMTEGKKVRILSPAQETDLTFSIEGIPGIPCTGVRNIPDGECYTAPVRDSINGTIKFGPSNYDGESFPWIKLTYKDGKIVEADTATDERRQVLDSILNRDEGARYTGEFAINFNPFIKHPTGDILFDEKIDGGIHLAQGKCYDTAPNGNKSLIHWDMVHIQRPDYGGGELYIDDVLIRKDGIFVLPELQGLNPENLKAATSSLKSEPSPS